MAMMSSHADVAWLAANLAKTVVGIAPRLRRMFEMPTLVHLRRAKYQTSSSCPVAPYPPPMPASHSPLTARSIPVCTGLNAQARGRSSVEAPA